MAPPASTTQALLLSPAELSYLHTSLCLTPPIRPDARAPTQFRPLIAETNILPPTNGSARVCFADGTEAVVGVKAEVERAAGWELAVRNATEDKDEETEGKGEDKWVDLSIEIPGLRDDDALPVFLSAMLNEALLADGGGLVGRLRISDGWHWRLYIDILLLSPPLSYPIPLLSLTTSLALLSTRLPKLLSEKDEDPLFDNDWEASTYLYSKSKPPVTLLVVAVGDTILFDPTSEELAVADACIAISIIGGEGGVRVVALRTIDPPSRLTTPGVPDSENSAVGGTEPKAGRQQYRVGGKGVAGVWTPPAGGVKRGVIRKMVEMVVKPGGVGEEVLAGVNGVDIG